MSAFYILIALLISAIWVDYFYRIDLFDREKIQNLILVFVLGCATTGVVFFIDEWIFKKWDFGFWENTGELVIYSFVQVALVEEFAKVLPFLVMLYLFPKIFTEPIDYLVYICVGALGFAAVENVLYFQNEGAMVIHGRAILSTVSHMFDTALVAYGLILYRFHPKYNSPWMIVLMFFLATFSHGLYDFILMWSLPGFISFLLVVLYFLLTVSLFVVILNNALNNSEHFHYGKMHNPHRLTGRLIYGYAIVFGLEFVALAVEANIKDAVYGLSGALWSTTAIVGITSIRLSRFKLVKDRWEKLKLELPFSFGEGSNDYFAPGLPAAGALGISISIKGDSFNEYYLNRYYQSESRFKPVTRRKTHLGQSCEGRVESKHFFDNLESAYAAQIDINGKLEPYLIKPKLKGKSMANNNTPIVALLKPRTENALEKQRLSRDDFGFCEWVYLLPAKGV